MRGLTLEDGFLTPAACEGKIMPTMEYSEERMDRELAEMAQLFRLLGHPLRLQLLEALARDEACVCHLVCAFGLRQPHVSQQLAELRRAGLVAVRHEHNYVYYRLANDELRNLIAHARQVIGQKANAQTGEGPSTAWRGRECRCPRCRTLSTGAQPDGGRLPVGNQQALEDRK